MIVDQQIELSEIEEFWNKNVLSNKPGFKVVLLVRDPRAVTNSREFIKHCDSIGKSNF